MKNKNFIFEELKEISPLIVKIEKTEVYFVPLAYFNNLPLEIFKKIMLEKAVPFNLTPVIPYSTPPGYFKNFPESLFKKIYSNYRLSNEVFEETEAIAPILNTINKNPVYNIPKDFFEKRQSLYIEVKKEGGKVISMRNLSKGLRFSAAAVIILFLAINLYTRTEKNRVTGTTANHAENEMKNLSKEEIVHFLKTNIPTENITLAPTHTLKYENAIKSSLKQISDKEIQQFLKETGESDEI